MTMKAARKEERMMLPVLSSTYSAKKEPKPFFDCCWISARD